MCEQPMNDEHNKILCAALKDCKLVDGDDFQLQVVGEPQTGKAGLSTVYRLRLFEKGKCEGKGLIAKFDAPDRAAKEWNAIAQLIRSIPVRSAILPVHYNKHEHGVVIYEFAGDHASSGTVLDFAEFLDDRFFANPSDCLKALEKVHKALEPLHNGKASQHAAGLELDWSGLFPKLTEPGVKKKIRSAVASRRDKLNNKYNLQDPLLCFDRPPKLAGRAIVSQIHGDLNFSNVLFALDQSNQIHEVFLIDLAHWKQEAITAYDVAVMEMQFWFDCWPKLCEANKRSRTRDVDPVQVMVTVGRFFNDPANNPLNDADSKVITVCRFIHRHRSYAQTKLSGASEYYRLADYMTALYLNFLRAFTFDTDRNARGRVSRQIAYAGAALACEYLSQHKIGKSPNFPAEPLDRPDPKAPAPMRQSLEEQIRSVFNPDCGDSLSPCYVDPHDNKSPGGTAEVLLFEGPENLGKTQKWLHWLNERQQNQRVPSYLCTKNTTSSQICQFLKHHAVRLNRAAPAGQLDAAVQGEADNNCWQNTALALSASNVRALAIQDIHKLEVRQLMELLDASEILLRTNVTVGLESRQPLLINPAVRIHRKNFVPWSRTLIEQSLRLGEQRLSFKFADSATDALAKYCVGEPRALHALSQAFVIKYLKPRDTLANEVPEIGRSGTDAIVKEAEDLFLFDRGDGLKRQVDSLVKRWKRAKKWWDEDGHVQDWRDFGAELVKHILEESVMWAVSPSGYPRAEFTKKLEKKLNRRLKLDDTGFGSTQLKCSLKSVPTWNVREWFRFTGGHVWIEKKGSDWDLHLTDASFRAFLVLAGDVPRAAAKQATNDALSKLPT
jgi:hypothetical protein